MRKILKIITFCFLLLITISTTRKIYASSEEINVHIIVSQIKVNKKEELIININIDNIEKVYELKLGILKHSDLEPVVGVDGYFQLNKNTTSSNNNSLLGFNSSIKIILASSSDKL